MYRPGEIFLAHLSVVVEEEVLRRFKQLVIRKHGKLKGMIAKEVTEALRLWIEKQE